MYDTGLQIICKVTSPVTEGSKVYNCTGWTGTGSVPPGGEGTDVTFPITQESTLIWNWNQKTRSLGAAQVASLVAIALIFLLDYISYEGHSVILSVVFSGAIGGLLHEIVQSGGTYMLPKTDDKGNFCLGGLIGIITGGLAGLILSQGLNLTTLNVQLLVQAFLAGLALKGVADAVNPPTGNQKAGTPASRQVQPNAPP